MQKLARHVLCQYPGHEKPGETNSATGQTNSSLIQVMSKTLEGGCTCDGLFA